MNVYDFDNTIYDGESGVDLFKFFLRKDPGLLLKIPWGAKLLYDYKFLKLPLQTVLDKHTPRIEAYGQKIGDLRVLAKEFWDKNAIKIKPFYIKQRSEDDLIISACLDFVLDEVCRRLGGISYIGSEVDMEKKTLIRFCYRENKVLMFKEKYPGCKIDNLYTDSFNDQPLMDISENVYLVSGNKVTKIK